MSDVVAVTAITDLIPHQGRMVLLDSLIDHTEERTVCRVVIGRDSMFIDERGVVPNWVGIEYIAQTIAAYSGCEAIRRGDPVSVGFLLGARTLRFHTPHFSCGQRLLVEAWSRWNNEELGAFDGLIRDEPSGALMAEGRVTVYQPREPEVFLYGG